MSTRAAGQFYFSVLLAILAVGVAYTVWSMQVGQAESQQALTQQSIWGFAEQPLLITD